MNEDELIAPFSNYILASFLVLDKQIQVFRF